MVRHLPNLVTGARGLAGFAVLGLLWWPREDGLAFVVFVAAMFTDLFDGALARRLGSVGELGQWLDPISDKLLTNGAWIGLWASGWAPGWLAAPMILRDLGVALGYVAARRRGRRYEVSAVGRLALSVEGIAVAVLVFHGPWIGVDWVAVGTALGALALTLSMWAALAYLRDGPLPAEGAAVP